MDGTPFAGDGFAPHRGGPAPNTRRQPRTNNSDEEDFVPDIKVLRRFGEAYSEQTRWKKTRLQLVTAVKWKSFVRYLDLLMKNNHISQEVDNDNEEEFKVTSSGRKLFEMVDEFFDSFKNNKSVAAISVFYIATLAIFLTRLF